MRCSTRAVISCVTTALIFPLQGSVECRRGDVVMLKMIDIHKQEDGNIFAHVVIEGRNEDTFDMIFTEAGKVIASTATEEQRYYEAQARIAFRNHYDATSPPPMISSMWY